MTSARGSFDVSLAALAQEDGVGDASIGRRGIDKRYHGDLDATGLGQMLATGGGVPGSAAYVAIEKVTGSLNGRRGSFALHHTGVMTRGAPQLSVLVVPDSGTDELIGLSGSMTIEIVDKQHLYSFDYRIEP